MTCWAVWTPSGPVVVLLTELEEWILADIWNYERGPNAFLY
jgi:hypothetical protein